MSSFQSKGTKTTENIILMHTSNMYLLKSVQFQVQVKYSAFRMGRYENHRL